MATRSDPSRGDLAVDRDRALALIPVSRETAARLDRIVALLLRWQKTVNLIAPSTASQIWTRHVADSLQVVRLAPDAKTWIDLGSGGGLPGLVIACALTGVPGTVVHLVESNAKKAAFLREAARTLELPALVHATRIEDFGRTFGGPVDVVTARALAPLGQLLAYAEPWMKRGAQAVFPKGQDVEVELTDAAKCWNMDVALAPSLTDDTGHIVIVRRAECRDEEMNIRSPQGRRP